MVVARWAQCNAAWVHDYTRSHLQNVHDRVLYYQQHEGRPGTQWTPGLQIQYSFRPSLVSKGDGRSITHPTRLGLDLTLDFPCVNLESWKWGEKAEWTCGNVSNRARNAGNSEHPSPRNCLVPTVILFPHIREIPSFRFSPSTHHIWELTWNRYC